MKRVITFLPSSKTTINCLSSLRLIFIRRVNLNDNLEYRNFI